MSSKERDKLENILKRTESINSSWSQPKYVVTPAQIREAQKVQIGLEKRIHSDAANLWFLLGIVNFAAAGAFLGQTAGSDSWWTDPNTLGYVHLVLSSYSFITVAREANKYRKLGKQL